MAQCYLLLLGLPVWGWSQSADSLQTEWLSGQKVTEAGFNQGLIYDPLQLVQGKLPGLLIARAGNDPNGSFDAQMRGLQTFGNSMPFFLVDGIPMESLDAIHPADVAAVEVLAPGSSLWSGMRAGNGLVRVQTKAGHEGKPQLVYRQMRATEKMMRDPGMMSAIAFRRAGGQLATSSAISTNWWEEITRRAGSETHHLSLSSGNAQSSLYASAAYDQIEGTVWNAGFHRLNGRLNFRQRALNDRLQFQTSINLQNRTAIRTPYHAFIQATQYNPTAPVRSEEPEFATYEGYYQAAYYNNYNPVAILEQNRFAEDYHNLQAHLQVAYDLSPALRVEALVHQQSEDLELRSFFPSTSLYLGLAPNGLAARQQSKQDNQLIQLQLQYEQRSTDWTLHWSARAFAQKLAWNSLRLQVTDFLTDAFTFNNLAAGQSTARGESSIENSKTIQSFQGLGTQLQFDYQSRWGLQAAIHYEGASHLGANRRWAVFYEGLAYAKMNDHWRLELSYSQRGNVPDQGMLSQGTYLGQGWSYRFPVNGVYQEAYLKEQEANPDLQWERVRTISMGSHFKLMEGRLRGALAFYYNRADQLIVRHWLDYATDLGRFQYRNTGELATAGVDFSVEYQLYQAEQKFWTIGLIGTRYLPSRIVTYYGDGGDTDYRIGIIGGGCNYPIFWIADGERLGAIRGHTLLNDRPVAADGSWNFSDKNRDGYFGPDDYEVIGNALPRMQLGISNRWGMGNWSLDMTLRGVFGHDIIQHTKSLHSPPSAVNFYNGWAVGVQELRGLEDYPDFSERDVESGSFLRLDNLQLRYRLQRDSWPPLQLFVAAQNLFTISAYSGVDPEYRPVDRNLTHPLADTPLNAFVYIGEPLVQGMDRRNTFPLSRTFSAGFQLVIE